MVERKRRVIPDTITEEELLRVIKDKGINEKRRMAYAMLFYQALRISELMKLEKEDDDSKTKLLHIKQAKGGKDRKIPIMPETIKIVRYLPLNSKKAKDKGVRALQIALKKDTKSERQELQTLVEKRFLKATDFKYKNYSKLISKR